MERMKIKVLVFPVNMDSTQFQKYLEIFRKVSTVPVSEIGHENTLFNQGFVHYDFVTGKERNSDLEELDLCYHIFGVIGLVHCQRGDVVGSVKTFQGIVGKYPSSLSQRLFAFEPLESQKDDIPGIVMIPNVGDITFYLSTMIQDFTRDILGGFSILMGQIERKPIVQGPIMIAPPFKDPSISQDAKQTDIMAAMVHPEKTKKKTPGRIQKLLGDLLMLVGRADLAIDSFANAIESAKNNADYQWQASALEGFTISRLMTLVYQSLLQEEVEADIKHFPTLSEIFKWTKTNKELFNFVCEIPERYREVAKLYEMAYPYGSLGFYPIFQLKAMLSCAEFLVKARESRFDGVFLNSGAIGWYAESKTLSDLAARMVPTPGLQPQISTTLLPQPSFVQPEKVSFGEKGTCRLEILSWITRAALCGTEFLTGEDLVYTLSWIATICGKIGAFRKHAFFLRLVAMAAQQFGTKYDTKNPSLECMHRVLQILESGDGSPINDDLVWLRRYHRCNGVEYGWPQLRLAIHKEAIQISNDRFQNLLLHASMLRKLFPFMTIQDQGIFSEQLQKVILYHRKSVTPLKFSQLLFGSLDHQRVLGVPILKSIVLESPKPRYIVTKQTNQPQNAIVFLYSPFAKQQNSQIYYVAGEPFTLTCELVNPYLFEIDVQNLQVVGANIACIGITTTLPSSTTHVVSITCTAPNAGTAEIHGVVVKMMSGCLEEFLIPLERYHQFVFHKDNRVRLPLVQDDYGSAGIKSQPTPEWKQILEVIEPQPMLEIVETSLAQKAVTVLEGETTNIRFRLKNISKSLVNYMFVKIQEQTEGMANDVYDNQTRAFFYENLMDSKPGLLSRFTQITDAEPTRIDLSLLPDEELEIPISVFGKPSCTGANITFVYGNADSTLYTRQVSILVLCSVVKGITIRNMDIVECIPSLTSENHSEKFLLTFDVSNKWDEPIQLDIHDTTSDTVSSHTLYSQIQRITIPVRKFLIDYDIKVPSSKQFVVSDQFVGIEKEKFAAREEIFGGLVKSGLIVMTWKTLDSNRKGCILPQYFGMKNNMIPVIRRPWFHLSNFTVTDQTADIITNQHISVPTNKVVECSWAITASDIRKINRTVVTVVPVVQTDRGLIHSHSVFMMGPTSTILTVDSNSRIVSRFLLTNSTKIKLLVKLEPTGRPEMVQYHLNATEISSI